MGYLRGSSTLSLPRRAVTSSSRSGSLALAALCWPERDTALCPTAAMAARSWWWYWVMMEAGPALATRGCGSRTSSVTGAGTGPGPGNPAGAAGRGRTGTGAGNPGLGTGAIGVTTGETALGTGGAAMGARVQPAEGTRGLGWWMMVMDCGPLRSLVLVIMGFLEEMDWGPARSLACVMSWVLLMLLRMLLLVVKETEEMECGGPQTLSSQALLLRALLVEEMG